MAVAFANNFENILDKLESLLKTEFGGSLKIYRTIKDDIKDNQYLLIMPSGSDNISYLDATETRSYAINLILHYRNAKIQKNESDQIMRLISRIETVIENNPNMTLTDSSVAYDCKIESTEIDRDDPEDYVITLDFSCTHVNNI